MHGYRLHNHRLLVFPSNYLISHTYIEGFLFWMSFILNVQNVQHFVCSLSAEQELICFFFLLGVYSFYFGTHFGMHSTWCSGEPPRLADSCPTSTQKDRRRASVAAAIQKKKKKKTIIWVMLDSCQPIACSGRSLVDYVSCYGHWLLIGYSAYTLTNCPWEPGFLFAEWQRVSSPYYWWPILGNNEYE